MRPEVKSPKQPRTYDGRNRKISAEQTRAAILAAAARLFINRGYQETTMAAIAAEAQVAVDTIYAAVGPKPAIIRLLIELALSGTDEIVPAVDRAFVADIANEPDPARKIARYGRALRETHERLAPVFTVLIEASATHPELAAMWSEISERRASNMKLFVAELASTGGVRPEISLDEAADFIWATNSPQFYQSLVETRGWSPDTFERWVVELWTRTLLV